ncbi:CCHC-type domain-containing protein [Trichonephila clavipes]|uniref:CCHC-type domain-containing protein n=1 Tax=Trichonephila clavipes TaxID=2585209 RepID=A0A8X6RZ97_TRICX|nr:CCHC-type domain-containing protein [Trichonephila clavipes]
MMKNSSKMCSASLWKNVQQGKTKNCGTGGETESCGPQLIARYDEDDAQNYEKVKEMLLKRFPVIGDRFRQYFSQQKKNPYLTWRHFYFELSSYFEETFKKKEEFRKPFPIKKNQTVGGSHDNHSPGPFRTLPRFPSYNTERNTIQCCGCGTPGVVKSKCPTCTRANEMETSVNCMMLFNLNSNLYPTSMIVLKIFGEKIAVCVDTGASHTIASEKMFKFLQENAVTFTNKRISFTMPDEI